MSDREKYGSDNYDYAEKQKSEQSSVEDIPAKESAESDKVKGGMVSKPVMLPVKPDQY